jgi:hypothetical protein
MNEAIKESTTPGRAARTDEGMWWLSRISRGYAFSRGAVSEEAIEKDACANILYRILSSRTLGIGLMLLGYIYLQTMPGRFIISELFITNLLILLVSLAGSFADRKRPFTLFKLILLFFAIFFGLAPILEYKLNLAYWSGRAISDNNYIIVNCGIVASLGVYIAAYKTFERTDAHIGWGYFISLFRIRSEYDGGRTYAYKLLALSSVLTTFVFSYFSFDVASITLRGGELITKPESEMKMASLFVGNYLRPMIFNCFATYLLVKGKINHYAAALLLFALFAASPTALPRFLTAALFLTPFLIPIWRSGLKGFHVNNIILLGMLFVFPLLDIFRYFGGTDSLSLQINLSFFTAGHFDAYQNFVRIYSSGIITEGRQLLGALLFFIPRSAWSTKPIGSGELLADASRLDLANISMPFIGEGYINFGWAGVLVFTVTLAHLTATLDKAFWAETKRSSLNLFPLVYMEIVGMTFFVMRGDLVNGIAYTCGILASIVTISWVLRI